MDHRLRQRQLALGAAEEVVGILRRIGDEDRQGVGLADVLHRHAHDPAGQIQRVLAAVEHPRQPVEGRIRVRPTHRFMQRGYEVVVLFSRLVVSRRTLLQNAGEGLDVQRLDAVEAEQHLRHGQQVAAVAVGQRGQRLPRLRRQRQGLALLRLGPNQQLIQRRVIEPLQHEHLRPRQQRPVQFERRVLGRRAHQGDDPLLHEGQEAVLLGAVEAVDLVDEQQGRLAGGAAHARRLEGLLQVGDAGEDGADLLELIARRQGQQARDGRLSGARRPPQDHRAEAAGLDHPPDRPALAQQVVLPHHLVQRTRPQPVGQRGVGGMNAGGFEQVGHAGSRDRRSRAAFHALL